MGCFFSSGLFILDHCESEKRTHSRCFFWDGNSSNTEAKFLIIVGAAATTALQIISVLTSTFNSLHLLG